MGRIQAGTGLVSGINYSNMISPVDRDRRGAGQLAADPNNTLTSQETALDQLSALLLSLQSVAKSLGSSSVLNDQTVTSSNTSTLTATSTGSPAAGTYQYIPLRTVQTQQFLGSGLQSTSTALGSGTLTFRYGTGVDPRRRSERDQRRVGVRTRLDPDYGPQQHSAKIDLSGCQTIDNVINAINSAGTINVTATADDGHIVLTDNTGDHNSDLAVKEVNNGTTAKSLGLAGVNLKADSTSNSVAGDDILKLYHGISLEHPERRQRRPDQHLPCPTSPIPCAAAPGTIDLSPIEANSSTVNKETTLSQILSEIGTQTDGTLTVAISSDGKALGRHRQLDTRPRQPRREVLDLGPQRLGGVRTWA